MDAKRRSKNEKRFAPGNNIITCTHRALRSARHLALHEGLALQRFRLIEGTDKSLLGDEWVAFPLHNKPGLVTVWRPIGEDNMNEALRTCTTCRWFGKWFFGISVRAR